MLIQDCKPIVLETREHLLSILHVLLAHEAEAEQEYTTVIEALRTDSFGAYELAEDLEEVRRDERNHMGVILRGIAKLCPEELDDMGKEE